MTRAALLKSIAGLLDEGFDGIHYDFEPISEGDEHLLTVLREAHLLTRSRGAILSVSAIHNEPWSGMAKTLAALPGGLVLWSAQYLGRVAREVDQVAVMSYDTALFTQKTYCGYVRLATEKALAAVPAEVNLLMGVPAYHDEHMRHHQRAETVAAAIRGIRLALGPTPPARTFGVAMYVDFAATAQDWASYRDDWFRPG